MGRLTISATMLLVALWANMAAADSHLNISEEDCRAIRDGSIALKTVPADVRDACDRILAVAPATGAGADAPIDPCGSEGSGNSVYCWGPWAALAPAAGGNPDSGPAVDPLEYPDRPEVLGAREEANNLPTQPPIEPPIEPPVVPELPLGACAPGASCGFATVVDGIGSVAPADETSVGTFELADDGTQFTVTQGETEIQSFQMQTEFTDRPDGLENLSATFVDDADNPTEGSFLQARVERNADDDVAVAADIWAVRQAGEDRSGFFAWGRAVSQADLDSLNSMGGATLNFSGVMSVDNSTVANITMNFGSESNWTGNWTNPNYNFSAGGAISGANFGSDPTQFSGNVQDGYVQGALVDAVGKRAVSHVVDVTLDSQGAIRDVGLALETP